MSEERKGPPKIDLREILDETGGGDAEEFEILVDDESDPNARRRGAAADDLDSFAIGDAGLEERHLRLRADFENYRRRKEQEMGDFRRRAAEGLVADLLPVVDNLERAMTGDGDPADPFRRGIELIQQQLWDVLQTAGLERVPAVGEPFDPEFHEAVARERREDLPPGTVVEELQKGYKFHGRLIRPAMVKVTYGSEQEESAAPGSEEES